MKLSLSSMLVSAVFTATASAAIPPLNVDVEHITVSGLSSGGYMANQFHIARSEWVSGAAILAAGPYFCAQGDITTALGRCVNKVESPIPLATLTKQAEAWSEAGKIDALSNLKSSRVWLLHGTKDVRVISDVNNALYQQYQGWVNKDNLAYLNTQPFAHVFPTNKGSGNCTTSESPYIGNCEYDAAGELLQYLLGNLNKPDESLSGEVVSFNQQALAGTNAATMGETGYAYIPASCKKGAENSEGTACKVHVSFHGCNQYAGAVGKAYVEQTGLNEWADDNQIVVVYPQTKKSLFMPLNPQGCWDWWGYTGADYATKQGPQIQAVEAIVKSLAN